MHKIRVYIDTSVFGGIHDDEFMNATTAFFERVRHPQLELQTYRELQPHQGL